MSKKRLNFKDDFELLYLRHDYLKKAKELDGNWVKLNAGFVHTTAKIMFSKLKSNFQKVGFDEEDVVAISNIYMLSYMALYSLKVVPQELDDYIAKRGPTSQSEIDRVDRNRLINFLRQKLTHCATFLCARKARNITVGIDRRGYFAETAKTKPVSLETVLNAYKKYGYRKVTLKEYKKAIERARAAGVTSLTDSEGYRIFKVEMLNEGMSEYDYELMTENNRGAFYQQPDTALEMFEDEIRLEAFKSKFNNMDSEGRRKMLMDFVEKNKGSKTYKQELRLARKMLKKDTVVV